MDEKTQREYVIPALPGFFVLSPIKNERGEFSELWREPIVAWRIQTEGNRKERLTGHDWMTADPVTCEGSDMDGEHAILHPGGTVTCPHVGNWPDEQGFLDYLKEETETNREARRAA